MPDATTSRALDIEGMSCAHCVAAVRRALDGMDGVTVRHVEIGRAEVEADPARVSDEHLAAALADEGFALR